MEWFRFYHAALDDPKVQRLPAPLFKAWVNVLCLANQSDPRGALPSVSDIAYRLRISGAKADELARELLDAGLLDETEEGFVPHNWATRQPGSDDVAKRVRKHRDKQTGNSTGNNHDTASVTLHVTLPETEEKRTVKRSRLKEKTREDTEQNREEKTSAADAVSAEAESTAKPFDILLWVCDELGQDVSEVTAAEKGKQLAAAKRMLSDGATEPDIRRETQWLRSQTWITTGVDLLLIEKMRGKWQMAGKPAAATQNSRASPPLVERGRMPADGGLAAWKAAGQLPNRE